MTGKRTFITLFAAMATLMSWTANAEDATCTCVCDSGSPDWACTAPQVNPLLGGGTTELPPMPDSCRDMSCPGADTTGGGLLGGGTGDTGDTGDDTGGILGGGDTGSGDDTGGDTGADDTIPSPVAGYECKRRSIYRPDLRKHKTYKVCRPVLSDEDREKLMAHYEKMRANWENAKTKKAKKHRKHKRHHWAGHSGKRKGHRDGND